MKTKRMGWISVSCLLLGLSAPGYAALAYVDDTVLDGLRGRYVDAGKIVNFGIQMTTIWRDADGTLSGVATQLTGRDNGQVRVSNYTLDGKTAGNPSSLPTTPGLASVQGVVQVNQLAGANNQSHNSATVEIDNAGAAPLALGTNWQPVSQSSANPGDGKSLQVVIQKGAAGYAGQSIGQGQLTQFSNVQGSNVAVENSLRIQVSLSPANRLSGNQLFNSLHHLMIGIPGR